MKKVALSLLAFALVGAGAFADATADVVKSPVTASLEVNGAAKWGVDLDTNVHGFNNEATGKVTLWFLNGSSAKTGEGDVHGYINVADVKFGFDGAANANAPTLAVGDVTAKIVAGDLYVKLYTNSNAAVDYSLDGDDDSDVVLGGPEKYSGVYGGGAEWTLGSTTAVGLFDGKGIEIGYEIPKVVALTAVVDSKSDWTDNEQNSYEASIAASLKSVDKLTLGGKFLAGQTDELKTAVGVEFAYDLGVAVPFAHANVALTDSTYDADFGAKLPLVDGFKTVVAVQYDSDSVANVMVTADLAEAKLAGPLSALAGVRMLDLTKAVAANAVTEIFVKVGFKATDTVKVYGSVDTYNTAVAKSKNSLFAKVGADFTGISLTTLSVNYDSSDLGAAKSTGDSKLGKLVVTAKVSY